MTAIETRRVITLFWKVWLIWAILTVESIIPWPPISSSHPWSKVLKVIFPEAREWRIRGCAEIKARNHIEELKWRVRDFWGGADLDVFQ